MHTRKQTVRERSLHYFSINLAIVEAKSGESERGGLAAPPGPASPGSSGEREDLQPRQPRPGLTVKRRNPAGGWQRVK